MLLIVVSAWTGDWSWSYVLLAVNAAAATVPQPLLRRNLRRSVALNSGSPAR